MAFGSKIGRIKEPKEEKVDEGDLTKDEVA